jgi:hypothetical protein
MTPTHSKSKKGNLSAAVKRRSGLAPVSEEMKAWSAALETEVTEWPRISRKAMFGMTALYRGPRIFAVLPRTRGMGSPNSLAFKLEKPAPRLLAQIEREPRIQTTVMRARRWYVIELSSDRDLRDALDWLRKAYEAAS